MEAFKNAIRQQGKKLHIDLLGFASRDRFTGVDPTRDPFSIFPDGKAVILIGRMIPRGALRGAAEGTDFSAYGNFGYKMLDDQFVATSTYELTRFIEDAGWEACPIFPNPDAIRNMGVPVAEGKPAPNVAPDFDFAAVACGLGVMGKNGELLTPAFGPRQRFQMIITDAPLSSDPFCEETFCAGCDACRLACPVQAIGEEKPIVMAGKTFTTAVIDERLCRDCHNGGTENRLHPKGKPDRKAAACTRACIRVLAEKGVGRMQLAFEGSDWAKDRRGNLL